MPVALMPCVVRTSMPQRNSASRVSPCSRGIFGGRPRRGRAAMSVMTANLDRPSLNNYKCAQSMQRSAI